MNRFVLALALVTGLALVMMNGRSDAALRETTGASLVPTVTPARLATPARVALASTPKLRTVPAAGKRGHQILLRQFLSAVTREGFVRGEFQYSDGYVAIEDGLKTFRWASQNGLCTLVVTFARERGEYSSSSKCRY